MSSSETESSQPPATASERALREAEGRAPASAVRTFGCGLAMGTADAVPGVSGGTIALILGIYDRFIGSLAAVVGVLRHPRDVAAWRAARRALLFLVPLGAGMATAYLVATRLLVGKLPRAEPGGEMALALRLLEEPPPGWLTRPDSAPIVFAFFFGLVLASVNEPWRTKTTRSLLDWPLALVGALGAVALSLSPPAAGSTEPFAVIGAGAIAVSVMLLPGVSGSLALLVLGMYQPISGAVHNQEWGVVAAFAVGIALGVATFVPLLRWVLARAHDRTMSLLSGLMAGSLAALWPWKAHYLPKFIPQLGAMELVAPFGSWWWPVVSAAAGAGVILAMSRIAKVRSGS